MKSTDREVPLYLNTEVSLAWRVQIEIKVLLYLNTVGFLSL